MKTKLLLIAGCFWCLSLQAQQLQTESGKVTFALQAPAGKLEAVDSSLSGNIDLKKGTIALTVDVAGFSFVSAIMPGYINAATTKRFHEYYLETKQYPQAAYIGEIVNLSSFNYKKDETYTIQTKGILTMHGTSKPVACKGKITVKGSRIYLVATLEIRPGDYKIRIPASLGGHYFERVQLSVQSAMIKI